MNSPRHGGDEVEAYVMGMDLLLSLSLLFLIIIVLNVNGVLIDGVRSEAPSPGGNPPLLLQVDPAGGQVRIGGPEGPAVSLDDPQGLAAIRQRLQQQGSDRIALAMPAGLSVARLQGLLAPLQRGLPSGNGPAPRIELLVTGAAAPAPMEQRQ